MVAIFSDHLAEGRVSTINGTGEQTRDYVYVGDVARANAHAPEGVKLLPERPTSAPAQRRV